MKKVILSFGLFLSVVAFSAEKKGTKELVLSTDNTLILNDEFSEESVTNLMEKATKLDASLKSGYPIYLFLYTPGGSIQAGIELIEYLQALNRPVHTITLFSASMGFHTVQHLGYRYIFKYGVLMSHKARGGFEGEFGGGLSQLDSRYGMWLRCIGMMDEQTVSRTKGKQTLKSYRASYDNELWLNGQEAVNQGYADEVVSLKCDLSLQGTEDRDLDFGLFTVTLIMSKCPLKTSPLGVKISLVTNKGNMPLKEFLAKNGKFGPDCQQNDQYTKIYKQDGNEERVKVDADLCAKDSSLTIESLNKQVEKTKSEINKDLKNSIKYSY